MKKLRTICMSNKNGYDETNTKRDGNSRHSKPANVPAIQLGLIKTIKLRNFVKFVTAKMKVNDAA